MTDTVNHVTNDDVTTTTTAGSVQITERPAFLFPSWAGPVAIVANVVLILAGILLAINAFMTGNFAMNIIAIAVIALIVSMLLTSIRIQTPGMAFVLEFFGEYQGTIRQSGVTLSLPFLTAKQYSVKVQNFESVESKVNDANGNPINISAIFVWQLSDTAKATYAVEDYTRYLGTQAESAIRLVASTHPYDSGTTVDENTNTTRPSLLGNPDIINNELLRETTNRVRDSGVEILEVRINNLAYSVEIAQAMLQRQQAAAVVEARKVIVDGAVGIVKEATSALTDSTPFTETQHAELVSNLLVVLVGEGRVTPTISLDNKKK